jgi:hypothetical protein
MVLRLRLVLACVICLFAAALGFADCDWGCRNLTADVEGWYTAAAGAGNCYVYSDTYGNEMYSPDPTGGGPATPIDNPQIDQSKWLDCTPVCTGRTSRQLEVPPSGIADSTFMVTQIYCVPSGGGGPGGGQSGSGGP